MIHARDPSPADRLVSTLEAQRAMNVEQHLRRSPYLSLRSIKCSCDHGKLLLSGQVPTFYLTQLAQSLARSVGGMEILNCVKVGGSGSSLNRQIPLTV